jgi:hypothetical protein
LYASQLLSNENWSKSPDSNERVNKAGNFLQIPDFFFHSLPQLYSDLSFLAKLLLEFSICNMGLVQHIQVIILPENLSQNKAEEENEKKTKDLQNISCFVDSFVEVWDFR